MNRAFLAGLVVVILSASLASSYELGIFTSSTGAGLPYSIRIDYVAVDEADAPNGSAYYLISAAMSYSGDSNWTICVYCFGVSNGSGAPRPATMEIGGEIQNQNVVIYHNQEANATFYATTSRAPSVLSYMAGSVNLNVALPQASGEATYIQSVNVDVKGPRGYYFRAIGALGSAWNSTLFGSVPDVPLPYALVAPGANLSITVGLNNFGSFSECGAATIITVGNQEGLETTEISPALPIAVPCDGLATSTVFTLNIITPVSGYSGPLDLNLTLST